MKKIIGILIYLMTVTNIVTAATQTTAKMGAPVPVECVKSVFSKTGSESWATFALKVTNNCGKDVNFQKSSITFSSNTDLDTDFWGDFLPLTYPDNVLRINSQPNPSSGYTASLFLHFPEESWARTVLHDKESFTIRYGSQWIHTPSDAKIYLDGEPPVSGEINIKNATAKPSQVTQNYAVVKLVLNGQTVNSVQVPWATTVLVKNLAGGAYKIEPENVIDSAQHSYVGSAIPNPVTVVAGQTVDTVLSYQPVTQLGTIKVQTPALPSALTDYTGKPLVSFTRTDTGALLTQELSWNTTSSVATLEDNATYQISTPKIVYNNASCVGTFNPSNLTAHAVNPLTTQLSYACTTVTVATINIAVTGLPCESKSVTVTFQPTSGTPVTKVVNISGGSGNGTVNLSDGVVYNVSTSAVAGYSSAFSPQPIMAKPNLTETVTFFPIPRQN